MSATWNISITVRGPFLTQTSGGARYGFDALSARNANRQFLLPGTLVSSKLKWAWEEIGGFDDVVKLLGDARERDCWKPNRKRLIVGDMCLGEQREGYTLHRIRIDEIMGAAATGALMIIESPLKVGEEDSFKGQVRLLGSSDQDAASVEKALRIGLNWLDQVGALGSVGFGKVVGARVERDANDAKEDFNLKTERPSRLLLELDWQGHPFCFSDHAPTDNIFPGQTSVPGGALKGALAHAWMALLGKPGGEIAKDCDPDRAALAQHFDKLVLRHARAEKCGIRAMPLPQSLLAAGDVIRDAALLDGPVLIEGRAPVFQIDWKGKHFAAADIAIHNPQDTYSRELRIRTAIDRSTGRAAESQLFAYESIVPASSTHWTSVISLDAVPKEHRKDVALQLASLLSALGGYLDGLGKTKARARVSLLDLEQDDAPVSARDGLFIVTLQTPVILGDPRKISHAMDGKGLSDAYAADLAELSNDSLVLVRYFARQVLRGGEYLHRRFQSRDSYRPWLLTESGSVFVLMAAKGKETDAVEKLKELQKSGLPLPGWAKERYGWGNIEGDDWRRNPYIRENGYGEIAVNLDLHWQLRPVNAEGLNKGERK